jgi:hypothetical protein
MNLENEEVSDNLVFQSQNERLELKLELDCEKVTWIELVDKSVWA